jgi:hypothetical protein
MAGILVLSALAIMGAKQVDPETPRVQEAVQGALNDVMDAGTYKTPEWATGPLNAATVMAMHTTLNKRLKEHLTGPALAAWQRSLHTAIDRDSDGEHVIVTAGGADRFDFEKVDVDGDSASALGRAEVWATWEIHKANVPGAQTGRPTEWDMFSASLVQIDGIWYVESLELNPETGGG